MGKPRRPSSGEKDVKKLTKKIAGLGISEHKKANRKGRVDEALERRQRPRLVLPAEVSEELAATKEMLAGMLKELDPPKGDEANSRERRPSLDLTPVIGASTSADSMDAS